jgi:curved DNA-binding protein CbpA
MSRRFCHVHHHPDPPGAASVGSESGDLAAGGEDEAEYDFEFDDDEDEGEFEFELDDGDDPDVDFSSDVDSDDELDISASQRVAIDTALEGLDAKSFYEVLLLPRGADSKAIKRAYYRLSKEYHPDKFYRKELGRYKLGLEVLFNKITEAYRVLGDYQTREEYDQLIFPEIGVDTADHLDAVSIQDSAPGEASVSVDFVPDALRKRQAAALEKKRQDLAKKAKRRRKTEKPVFMQKLQKQLAARIAKSRKHMEAGKVKQEGGDLQAAVTHYQIAMHLDPRNTKAKASFKRVSAQHRNARAEVLFRAAKDAQLAEDFKAAAGQLQEAVECRPTKGKYYNEFGKLIIQHTLQHRVGLEQLKKAVELESRNIPYTMDLAAAYADLGMPSNAVRAYERVLQMDKKHSAAAKALKKLR